MHDCSSGQDKGLLTVDGKTFVERLLLCFAPKVSAVLISANRYRDRYQTISRAVARASSARHAARISRAIGRCFDRVAACADGLVVSAAL
jgi:molybdopterin-guanine dinucleotide biosynthesis protein A